MIPTKVLRAVKQMQLRENEIKEADFSWNNNCIPEELQGFLNGILFAKSELRNVYAESGEDLRKELVDNWDNI